jgi:N-acetylneuraminate synthase
MQPSITIGKRKIGADFPPLVIAEIGINHEGSMAKAKRMVRDAAASGAECVKFQCHVVDDEMIPAAKKIIPGHTTDSIWNIMNRCAFSEHEDRELKAYTEKLGLIYLSTPFSRAAADRLHRMRVPAYKIGSGECNNYPLIEHIASFGKPIILSTGMNDLSSILPAVKILRRKKVPFALLHCVSLYPTPYEALSLGALHDLHRAFPDAVLGLSDHSVGIYSCLGAVALGASILEKHFTSDKTWQGPDMPLSVDPTELGELVFGARAVYRSLGGRKRKLAAEKSTSDFAYATVVTTKPVRKGEVFTKGNTWVKRPGTGEILAADYKKVLGKRAVRDIPPDVHVRRRDIR